MDMWDLLEPRDTFPLMAAEGLCPTALFPTFIQDLMNILRLPSPSLDMPCRSCAWRLPNPPSAAWRTPPTWTS